MNKRIKELSEYAGIDFIPYMDDNSVIHPDSVSCQQLENFYKLVIKEVFKEIREAGVMIPLDYWVGTKKGLILEFQKRLADEIEQEMLNDE